MYHLESPSFSEFLLTASVQEILIPKAPEIPKAKEKNPAEPQQVHLNSQKNDIFS